MGNENLHRRIADYATNQGAEFKEKIRSTKAAHTNDLRLLIHDYLLFRVAVVFKKQNVKKTLYGHEHSCTYNQILYGHAKLITLDAEKGYTDLIKFVELNKRDIKSATIYSRNNPFESFNTMHRRWYNGDWDEINDPSIPETKRFRNLPYVIENNIIKILQEELPDFKAEIEKNLK